MGSLVVLAALSFAFCFALTPLCRCLALRVGAVDHPDLPRKHHGRATPHLGGLPIAASFLGSCAAMASPLVFPGIDLAALGNPSWLVAALVAILATGLTDDLAGLSPRHKLGGQIVAAVAAWLGGLQLASLAGFAVPIWASLPMTVLWLLVCTNGLNLIDGVDGLASGVALIASVSFLVFALLRGNLALALVIAPLAGCLAAFLRHNFAPASIFLGDSGSLFIGFLLGCFGLIWARSATTAWELTLPAVLLAIPFLDVTLAVLRRLLRRSPIFVADREHIHHRLLDRGFSPRRLTLILYGCCGVGTLFATGIVLNLPAPGLVAAAGLLLILLSFGIRFLRYPEFQGFPRFRRGEALCDSLPAAGGDSAPSGTVGFLGLSHRDSLRSPRSF